ncbi:site-specific DNA-methyltransferase [Croceibacter atlanticus]|uniref:site-specific DNA-methyltransferase n=1 Tax=Croceibacter atlanticus TaxID=313588 RepID=UPI0030D7DEC3|tara:strand:- start:26773 stop:28863 length:2091 start_codon:yes stop_codon:yes gene_type:complete
MANNTYKQHLENLLKQDARFVDDEGELMGNKVKSFTDDLDEKLIELLLQDERSRTQFFIKIKEVYVFKASEFKFFLEQNKIDNSFTNYVNRIGLSVGGKFIKDNTDVVLDFPYKDCVLEGGQSTEEGLDTYFEYDEEVSKTDAKKGYKPQQYNEKQTKRKEIFFNTIVAKDEIDRLLEPKAFANITKYDANGESKPKSFTRDAAINKKRGLPADTITDNLIIKGNNLLALESLKEEFKGKVKLIYIDPPYNTGGDSFAYNDNFNHSSWLTFMKNRLEIAKDLLTENGLIFVQCDYNEDSYLKILMDGIFKEELYVTTITVKSNSISGNKTQHKDKTILKNKDSILVYKNNKRIKISPQYAEKTEWDTHYNSILFKGENGVFTIRKLKDVLIEENIITEKYTIKPNSINKPKFSNFIFKNKDTIFRGVNSIPKELEKLSLKNQDTVVFIENDEGKMFAYNGNRLSFLSNVFQNINGEEKMAQLLGDLWTDIDFQNTQNEGGVSLTNGKKPEALLKRIIEMTTKSNDIVLDYHLGSGTTSAVSLKLNRQFIGIEQMDYGDNDSVKRLNYVIEGEQSGISKMTKWKGGGSFVKLELAKNNQNAKDQILACNNYNELIKLFNELYSKYFLHYNFKIKEFQEVVAKEEKFIALPLEKQKEIFCKMLDNNQLYVNVSEMEDSKHNIAPEDIALTKDFYQIKE